MAGELANRSAASGHVTQCSSLIGSVLGVSVSRTAMLAHARTLTLACNYTEGEIMVCSIILSIT